MQRNVTNLILFVNSFLSYLLVFVVSIAVVGVAIFAGYKLRVRKDAKNALLKEQEQNATDGQ
ncbi:MAG: hypothetical protein LUH58_09575 [Lachnospiraceae bacterium]|nr:hypothetical protein [Lachnospiraceae bacterium]